MHPVLAKIGPLYIYSYGLMVALAFAVAILLSYREAPRFNIDKDKIVDFGIVILIGGLIGARLFFVLMNFRYYIANPIEIINLTKGGLVWYGGFLIGILVGIVFVKKNNINFWDGADLLAPFMALAQSIGRIGCFLNGCCYGIPAHKDYPLGVIFPQEPILRHPAQIYESITMLIVFLVLRRWQKSRHFKGEIFLGYAMLYSLSRFLIEFLRGDNPKIFIGLTIAQVISIMILPVCAIILIVRFSLWKKNSSRSA
ncbi:MAG: prolipoprotein diacylglyceryl transferase [Candidatus Omnitrophota bacterium]|nr:prolipoprotein diacylglyceryl transferase [Candidatus Omnitrophota bacterium]